MCVCVCVCVGEGASHWQSWFECRKPASSLCWPPGEPRTQILYIHAQLFVEALLMNSHDQTGGAKSINSFPHSRIRHGIGAFKSCVCVWFFFDRLFQKGVAGVSEIPATWLSTCQKIVTIQNSSSELSTHIHVESFGIMASLVILPRAGNE